MNGKESEIGIKDILNSPDVAYNVDATLRLPRHQLNFGAPHLEVILPCSQVYVYYCELDPRHRFSTVL